MDYFSLGSKLGYPDLNAIVYLLRKFKRLTSDLRLGSNRIESDYGVYNVTGGLTSVGGNFILEDDVTISSSDVLLNCFYTFHFTVVDVNLSGTVNRRVISVTGDTGDNGELEVVLEPSLLESDEVILPDFKVDIVFDEHEYYTPVSSLDITLTVDKSYITVGESNTVTATVLDSTGSPVEDLELQFNFNGDIVTDTTDSSGVASAEYTGTGAGRVTVTVSGKSIRFYDGCMVATVTGNSINLGRDNIISSWLPSIGDVLIDWGDGTSDTVNNPTTSLSHTYTDGEQSHSILFIGNVTSLGGACFEGCTGLTSVTIPNSVTSLGNYCFMDCRGLTSVTIPNSVTSLGNYCFYGCTGLTSVTIPNSVTSLGNWCFDHCTGLTSVTIPNSVTSLGNYCFEGCTGLTSVTIPNSVTSLGESCFDHCTGLTSVTIPNSVTSLGNYCFEGCTGLTSVTIPNSVTSLGGACFEGCTGLTSVTIPNSVTSLGNYCFYGCTGLTSVTIPNSVTSLGDACFWRCTNLTSITIPNSVTSLGDSCFNQCSALIDYQLYWAGNYIITYDSSKMPNNTDTIYTIPQGETANYVAKGYPSAKLVERGETLTLTCDKPIIQKTETSTITATLKQSGSPLTGKTLNYQVKHGSTVISTGTKTTNSSGQATISYVGTGIGDVDVIVSYGSLLQETYEVSDLLFYDEATSDAKWNTNYADVTLNRELVSDGTKLSYTADSGTRYCNTVIGATKNWFDSLNSYQIEFDFSFERDSSNSAVGIGIGTNGYNIHNLFSGGLSGNGHLKIITTGNTYQIYLDDVARGSPFTINGNNGFFFLIYRSGSITFKDLKIYPI